MNLLQDHAVKKYLSAIFLVCLCAVIFCFLFCFGQTKGAQALLLGREQAIADALLRQGVPPAAVAAALANEEDSGQGQALLAQTGRTERTPSHLISALRNFETGALAVLVSGAVLWAVLLLALALRFLQGRERFYLRAEQAILCFEAGDFAARLPRTQEGTLARLCAAVDAMALALRAKGDTERHVKEFLKDTVADISHQLKTPLAALRMYQEIILEDTGDPEVVAAFSHKTETALARMEGLIQALLKITRLDAGGIVFEKEWVELSALARQATAELATRAALEQKQLVFEGAPDAVVLCDPAWTCEALGNLVKNALEHTLAGGHVIVRWEQGAAVTRIVVTDDGSGIAPEDLHHIFKRFYRSRRSLDRQGVGLGLPLAKAIAEGQGGLLSVCSTPGSGASFALSFLTEL